MAEINRPKGRDKAADMNMLVSLGGLVGKAKPTAEAKPITPEPSKDIAPINAPMEKKQASYSLDAYTRKMKNYQGVS